MPASISESASTSNVDTTAAIAAAPAAVAVTTSVDSTATTLPAKAKTSTALAPKSATSPEPAPVLIETSMASTPVATAEKEIEKDTQPGSAIVVVAPTPTPTPTSTPTPVVLATPTPLEGPVPSPVKWNESLTVEKIDFWVWAGLGINYTSSAQTVADFSDLEFGRIKGPSSLLRGGFYVSDSAGLELSYKNTPGEAKSSETVKVTDGDYQWQTLSAEALYRPDSTGKSEWTWRLGLQQHQMPFLIPQDVNEVSVVDTSMTNLSLGFDYKKKLKKRLRLEWMMRYQYPISSASSSVSSYSVSPNIGFDGSIGTAYQLTENLYIGVYWYGQYHDFNFKYVAPSAVEISGSQTLFFTNFDVRLGLEF